MLKKFNTPELIVLLLAISFIFASEYYYIVLKDHDRAIFLGLWPPTMIILLTYINVKKQQNG